MKANLTGKRVAILATDGFEQSELVDPRDALRKAGARVDIISPEGCSIRGWLRTDWAEPLSVDVPLKQANARDYDALVLPGGVMNPDHLRRNQDALKFVREFFVARKPVGAICHGPWTLIDADVVRGRRVTSYPSLQTDLKNAGATWIDEEVVVDNGLVTSRKPDDLPAFIDKIIEEIEEGVHPSATNGILTTAGENNKAAPGHFSNKR